MDALGSGLIVYGVRKVLAEQQRKQHPWCENYTCLSGDLCFFQMQSLKYLKVFRDEVM